LQSWYTSDFWGRGGGWSYGGSFDIKGFDAACKWPVCIGDPANERNSLVDSIAEFFLDLNAEDMAVAVPSGTTVVSFSHFLPRPELFPGYESLGRVMGCHQLEAAVRQLGSSVHVFGHSHINLDRRWDGCRYVQNALGYPKERHYATPSLLLVWDTTSGVL